MKKLKKLLIALAVLCLCLTGCQSNTPTPSPSPEPEPELSPAEISEKAMDNFLAKIHDGKYTIDSKNFIKIYVYSKDLVWFDYVDEVYHDFAAMSVNNEVFQGFLDEDGLRNITFLTEGQAIDAANSRLPGYWLNEEVSEGNIYNLFYNQPEEPLTFVSHEESVKRSMLSYAGYGETALRLMGDVYLEMNDIDPTVVHLKATVDDDVVARIEYDDIDIVITFGEAKDCEAAEAWMKAPEYPEARTAWTDTDMFVLDSVFLPGYGEAAMPFPTFASYAMTMDQNFVMTDEAAIRDSRATEQDLADYIELLKKEGFEETKIVEDGVEKTVYRRMLREAYSCYSQIEATYNNGVNLVAKKAYDFPVYDDLDAVNAVIKNQGFTELPASENFVSLKGTDRANELTESWLYFFDYDLYLYVDIDFKDMDEMTEYLDQYVATLVKSGFTPVYESDEDEEVSYYASPDENSSFRYMMMDEDSVSLLYKSEAIISAEEAEKRIAEAGFPEIDLHDPITCRDLVPFEKVRDGHDYKIYLAFGQTFETTDEAEEFLNAYEAKLNEAGFGRVNPGEAGSRKTVAIYNEEKDMLVGLDLFQQQDGALVEFDFVAE